MGRPAGLRLFCSTRDLPAVSFVIIEGNQLMQRRILLLLAAVLSIAPMSAQEVKPIIHTLSNGMKFLLVPEKGDPNVAAGWVAKVGSVNERPGVTGVAHLFEHMMFKGTRTIGTSDIDQDLAIIDQLDHVRGQIREEEQALIEEQRRGLIDDAKDPANRSERHRELLDEFGELDRAAAQADRQGRDRPHLHRRGRFGHERRHQQRPDDLLHQRPGEQARAVVLDGVRPPAQPGFSRVLFRTRRGARGAPPARRLHADRPHRRAVRLDVLDGLALQLAGHRLDDRPRGPDPRGSARVL